MDSIGNDVSFMDLLSMVAANAANNDVKLVFSGSSVHISLLQSWDLKMVSSGWFNGSVHLMVLVFFLHYLVEWMQNQ
jgi:hypothetical protein